MRFTHEVVLLSLIGLAALGAGAWILVSRRRHVGDPEVRRRELIDARGRIIEGTVTDFRDATVYYAWRWRGVDYESSQDLTAFANRLPPPEAVIGPVSVKFLSKIPSNSIVMSEKWSGFSSMTRSGERLRDRQ
jgi:LPXTG-motif cell wall-anchored protein